MPGVPSGRGCEACRKQKKKCDLQKPSCTRCTRLQIPCIGCGQQRYKFKEQMVVTTLAKKPPATRAQQRRTTGGPIILLPSNAQTHATGAFVSVLEVADVRYDLSYYGGFLKDLPRRIGRNDVLDASVDALTCAHTSVYTGVKSPEALGKYVRALKTLRLSLGDEGKMRTPETLCGIYLIMICQSWIGGMDDPSASHGLALSQLLDFAIAQQWEGSFESELLITLSVPVIFESVFNPKVKLEPWFSKLTQLIGPRKLVTREDGSEFHSVKLYNLGRIPAFVREPENNGFEIDAAYQQMASEVPRLRARLDEFVASCDDSASSVRILTRVQAIYGIMLALAVILNRIMRIFDPADGGLGVEGEKFGDEIVWLAREAERHRPLGAGYVPLCLMAAWASTEDLGRRGVIEEVLEGYQSSLASTPWLKGGFWLIGKFESLRVKLEAVEMVVR